MSLAKAAAVTAVLFLVSCGSREGSDKSVAQQAGDQVGRSVTDFARGVGHGVDKQLEVSVELSEELANLGLSKTVAKVAPYSVPPTPGKDKVLSVYLISQKPFAGQLLARGLNAEGQEIGRATADVTLAADDARYVTFAFPEEMDSQRVVKYVLSLRQPAAPPSHP